MTSGDKIRPAGVLAAGGVLDRIVEARACRLSDAKRARPVFDEREITASPRRSFLEALTRPDATNIIAEIKHRSPSKGTIREDFNPASIAEGYARAGAAAISVLTEQDFFGGSLDHLRAVRAQVNLPLLRKDFIFDEYQAHESAEAGADCVLLIAALLDDELLARLLELAGRLRLDALVEVHTAQEMGRAAAAGAQIIGVNNRDLTTFEVDVETSVKLARLAPAGVTLVSESGIRSGEEIRKLRSCGYQAFLIGEHFMRATDPGDALKHLLQG